MTFAVSDASPLPAKASAASAAARLAPRVRDLRLDFFRGIAMFIILIAHTPGNSLTSWIPARWGFSDATEIFVFCSGMASAIAFGGAFRRSGWVLGTARVMFRVWQVYWAHVGLFFATLAMTIFLTELSLTDTNYWGQLNLWALFEESARWKNTDAILSFMTLTWVPNYFDILPMYMVVLAMMPLVMGLARVHVGLVFAFMLIVWLFAQESLWGAANLSFPAEPWSDRRWFFNPFGWQLVFFTGFAFMRGWLPKPPVCGLLIVAAAAVVIANVPLSNIGVRAVAQDWFFATETGNPVIDARIALKPLIDKSDFGLFRFLQFLSLAYLAWVIAGDNGDNLLARGRGQLARIWGHLLSMILKVGQQSLAVFVVSMFIARIMGFCMDMMGRDILTTLFVNLTGALVLVVTAYGAGWFKSTPWKRKNA